MKKIMIGAVVVLILASFTASAQYGRHSRRGDNHYYSYNRYPVYNRYPSYYNYYRSRPSVSIIASVPFGAIRLSFGNNYYHYYHGLFYRPYSYGYTIVEPPIGIIVPTLPPGCVSVIIGARPYYRYENIFYEPYGSSYRVIEQPRETETSSATVEKTDNTTSTTTSEYEKVVLDGKTYYKKGDKYYKATVNDNGEITYKEAGGVSK